MHKAQDTAYARHVRAGLVALETALNESGAFDEILDAAAALHRRLNAAAARIAERHDLTLAELFDDPSLESGGTNKDEDGPPEGP